VRDAVLVVVAGAALAYGAYMEFRSDPWWLTAIGVACVGGAVVWKWRKGP
jgi:membrane protein implicated in regulation of membrane protease activity